MDKLKYKMLAVDLDGTLLTDDKRILDSTIRKIKEIVNNGIVFVIATGRSYSLTKPIADMIGLNIPLVLYNGTVVTFSNEDIKLIDKKLDSADAKIILTLIKEQDSEMILYSNEKIYCTKNGPNIEMFKEKFKYEVNFVDYEDLNLNTITKIIWIGDNDKLIEYQNTILKDKFKNTHYFTSCKTYLEFVNKECSKLNGIKELAKYYNIGINEVIAIGDGMNDYEMVTGVGLGIAMANGNLKLKEDAIDVTRRTNNEDGVGEIIDKYFLNK